MKGHWITYSAAELAWLQANCTLIIDDYHRAFSDVFGRHDVSAANLHALRKRKGWRTGRTGTFEKGVAPVNKGKRCGPGAGGNHPNAVKAHFKKGSRAGKAANNYKPIGTERITKDGYREVKVHDGMPFQSRWQQVHRLAWESVNGPVPVGMALKCLGDKLNTDPSNWTLVPRALLPRLAGGARGQYIAYDAAPDDLKPAILAAAKLDHRVKNAHGRSASLPPPATRP